MTCLVIQHEILKATLWSLRRPTAFTLAPLRVANTLCQAQHHSNPLFRSRSWRLSRLASALLLACMIVACSWVVWRFASAGRGLGCSTRGRPHGRNGRSSLLEYLFTPGRQYNPVSVCGEMLLNKNSACAPVKNSSLQNSKSQHDSTHDLTNRKPCTYKLSVMYPSRSVSYFLNTSVIRFKDMQA